MFGLGACFLDERVEKASGISWSGRYYDNAAR